MRAAFADPPYPGQSKRHYSREPSYAGEVDHAALLRRLTAGYDSWALSTASTTLKAVLQLPECPDQVRIGAWVKPFASFKPNVNPAYAWEPVIFGGLRKRQRSELTVRDYVSSSITLKRGVHGAKPDAFCFWLFAMLGIGKGDTFDDLFPGSGAVSAAWDRWCAQALPL